MVELRRDDELVQAYLEGEKTAFGRLAERYQPRLFKFAYNILNHYQDAENAVQETLLGALQNIRVYPPTRKFSSWLYGICRKKCYDELRKRYRKLEVPLPEDIAQLREGEGKLYKAAVDKAAREWCLAVLNHRQHRLYNLVMVQGRPYEAIAQEEKEFRSAGTEADIARLRNEFAEIMEIVHQRHKERIRRDREAARDDKLI